ncbi:hypothetical protein LQ757_08860 [Agromyces sp. SYSU K20354]|uniref:DUF6993 domain-containing protein n=1 Tax=Agromyces cavernae TaxID=2898659 RepID=UPI001E50F1B0|nr:hypothetical protein [Agromyces cavernae]MCD2442383.1 hypothetical protein [Agromyces cavernae]
MAQPIGATAAALVGVLVALVLSGCAVLSQPTAPTSGTTPSAAAPAVSEEPVATEASGLRPDLPAAENLAFFDSVNAAVVAANDSAGGREFIDALTAAGFDRSAMQVTADRTTVDLQAGSVQFSVLMGDGCLVGQYGPASGGYHGAVRPALGTGGCLVGRTRPIDW